MIKKYHFSIIIAFAFFLLLGLFLTPKLNIQFKADTSSKNCKIDFVYPNYGSQIVENEVTSKIENSLSTIKNIKHITSHSSTGKGNVTMIFNNNVDFKQLKIEVFSRLRAIYDKLPKEVPYPEISFSDFQEQNNLIQIGFYNQNKKFNTPKYIENTILPKLSRISGIQEIHKKESVKKKYVMLYNSEALQKIGLDPEKLNHYMLSDLKNESIAIDVKDESIRKIINISTFSKNSIPQFFNTYYIHHNKQKIFLKDIAVLNKEKVTAHSFKINDFPTTVLDIVLKNNANQITVEKNIFKTLKVIELPTELAYLITKNTVKNIRNEINNVIVRALLSFLVLIIVIFCSKRNWKLLIMIISCIVTNIMIAQLFYFLFNINLNLYSIASIAICFGLITDNIIIIMSHFWSKGKVDKEIIVPVLAATMTTISVLAAILLIRKDFSATLKDFSWVLIINLLISIAISFLLVPSLILQFKITSNNKNYFPKVKSILLNVYKTVLFKSLKYKYGILTLFILLFGFPMFLIKMDHQAGKKINENDSSFYQNKTFNNYIKPVLGGSLTYFIENKKQLLNLEYNGNDSHLNVKLHQDLKSNIDGLTASVKRFTKFLDTQEAINYYKINRNSDLDILIEIFFKKNQDFHLLDHIKRNIEALSLHIDGMKISVYGNGNAFGNSASETSDGYIKLRGYNINSLYKLADNITKKHLYKNKRVSYVEASSNPQIEFKKLKEYEINRKATYHNDVSLPNYFKSLERFVGKEYAIINSLDVPLSAKTTSKLADFNEIHSRSFTIDSLGTSFQGYFDIKERYLDKTIVRKNKLYQLYLNFSYKGNSIQSKKFIGNVVNEVKKNLPIGFKISSSFDRSGAYIKTNHLFLFLFVVLLVNFFICSILFESLSAAFKIVVTIPISFIGIFITYPLLDVSFDIGGVASFFLISGLSANAMIYVYSEYKKIDNGQRLLNNYLKAFVSKIDAIVLTIISTVVGLIPFILFDSERFFWTSFAYGTIGGMLFSLITLLFFFPLTLKLKHNYDSISN